MRAALAVPLLAVALPLSAQDTQVRAPLRPLADHPAPVFDAPSLPALLVEAAPAVGLFRSAGLPAGLYRDIGESHGMLRFGLVDASGTYRRPLDPDDSRSLSVRAAGWRPVGSGSSAWGRVVAEDVSIGRAGAASHLAPYGSSPLVLADTSSPKLHTVRAALEGAMGWSSGAWLFGVAAGLDVREDGTRDSRFVRSNRAAQPGVQLAFGRDLLGLTVMLHGRWTGGSETIFLRPQPQQSRAFLFSGLEDPLPIDVVPPGSFFRRTQRDAYGGGIGLEGTLLGQPWVLSVSRTYRHDVHTSEVGDDPANDDWIADGWTLLAAHQRPVGSSVSAILQIEASRLVGDVTLAAVDGVVTRVRETLFDGALDLRWSPTESHLLGALRLGLGVSQRKLNDYLRRVGADLIVWKPSAVAEMAYVSGGSAAALAFGVASAGPYATLPRPSGMGLVYQQFIAPTWSREATKRTTVVSALTLRQRISSHVALLGQAELTDLSHRGAPVPASSRGNYREWQFSLGLVGVR